MQSKYPSSSTTLPQKKGSTSLTQTFYLVNTTRRKLSSEASRPDHDLRLLVGYATLLDTLMIELVGTNQNPERRIDPTENRAAEASENSRPIQCFDSAIRKPEQAWKTGGANSSDSDSVDDRNEDLAMTTAIPLRRIRPPPANVAVASREVDGDDVENYDDTDDLALVRTTSHSQPELFRDSYA